MPGGVKSNHTCLIRLDNKVNTSDAEIVTTKNGRPAAVLVSPDEFEGWNETLFIRSYPDFLKEIKKGIRALKQNKAKSTPSTPSKIFSRNKPDVFE